MVVGVVDGVNPDHGYISGKFHGFKTKYTGGLRSFLPTLRAPMTDSNQVVIHQTHPKTVWVGQQYI